MNEATTSPDMEEIENKIDELKKSQETIKELMDKIEKGTMESADEAILNDLKTEVEEKKGGRKTRKQQKQKAGKSKKQQKQKAGKTRKQKNRKLVR